MLSYIACELAESGEVFSFDNVRSNKTDFLSNIKKTILGYGGNHPNTKLNKLDLLNQYQNNNLSERNITSRSSKFNNWLKEFNKAYKNFFSMKEQTFFKEKYTEKKLEVVRISKGVKTKGVDTGINYNNIYQIEEINNYDIYNIHFFVPCRYYPQCQYNEVECQCEDIKQYFDSINVLIYDILIKHFHIPTIWDTDAKEIFFSYYYHIISKSSKNKVDIKYFSNLICYEKMKQFKNDINMIKNFTKMEILNINELKFVDEKESLDVDNDKDNQLDRLKSLYKVFTIWNTLFIIFFKKNSDYVRKLKENSYALQVINKFQDNINGYRKKYESVNKALFIKLFQLDNKDDLLLEKLAYQYKQGQVEGACFEYDRTGEEMMFFEEPEKYMLEDNSNTYYSKDIIPAIKDKELIFEDDYYPSILGHIWDSLHQLEKFYLFFGYNKYVIEEVKLDNFLKNDFLNENDMKYEVYIFFNATHRAELLKILDFSKKFSELLIEKLKEFKEKNQINDNNKIEEVKTGKQVLKYMHDIRINYIKYYDFITEIFSKILSKPKEIVKELKNNFKDIFQHLYTNNENYFTDADKKIEFAKFYKLYVSRAIFDRLHAYFDQNNEKDNEDDMKNETNVRDKFKRDEGKY